MSVIRGIKAYMQTCPYLQELTEAYVDFTSEDTGNYGIMPSGETILKRYLRGKGAQKQYNFVLYAREFTFEDLQRVENCEFLEHLSDWIFEQNAKKNHPDIGANKTVRSIECANGMLFDLDAQGDRGLYQIQFQITYDQKGE